MQQCSKWLSILVLPFLLSGCGLSKADKQKVKGVQESLTKAESFVAEEKRGYEAMKASTDYSILEKYDSREKWVDYLTAAEGAIKHAKEVFSQEVDPLVRKNKAADAAKLTTALARVESSIKEARTKAKIPGERVGFINEVRERTKDWLTKAESEAKRINARFTEAESRHTVALSDHPVKKDEIMKRFGPVAKTNDNAVSALKTIKTEIAKGEQMDYLVFGDSCKSISEYLLSIDTQSISYEGQIAQLYRDYSKTLVDMKEEYKIVVGRTSWDESSDWSSDTEYSYQSRTVSEEIFDYFDDLPDDVLLASYGGWGGLSVKVDPAKWNQLGIEAKESWPGWSHSNAEYYIADLDVDYFHKYVYVEDDKKRDGDWEKVSDKHFSEHWDDLGMTLVSKPYGVFEDETIKVATPPGLAQVGNPKYGEWKTDTNGSSFWEWYGKYHMISSIFGGNQPHVYYRSDWDDWNRNYRGKSPYYGKRDEDARYGTFGTHVRSSPRYAGSTFSSLGGFKEVDHEIKEAKSAGRRPGASVRGAGPSGRSGGPGGGGK